MHGSVCASVYRCICMEVYMHVRVFIGVYAWKCMCECICMEVYVRVFRGVYAWKCMCECLEVYMHGSVCASV